MIKVYVLRVVRPYMFDEEVSVTAHPTREAASQYAALVALPAADLVEDEEWRGKSVARIEEVEFHG